MKMTDEEKQQATELLMCATAWLIDTVRAIKNGGLEQRGAAIAQCETVIDALAELEI